MRTLAAVLLLVFILEIVSAEENRNSVHMMDPRNATDFYAFAAPDRFQRLAGMSSTTAKPKEKLPCPAGRRRFRGNCVKIIDI